MFLIPQCIFLQPLFYPPVPLLCFYQLVNYSIVVIIQFPLLSVEVSVVQTPQAVLLLLQITFIDCNQFVFRFNLQRASLSSLLTLTMLVFFFLYFRKREKAERRAPYRKWPLPAGRGPSQRAVSRTQRSVTLPCIICTFLVCACLYSLVVIVVLSNLTDGIKIY